jgi:hypothetical protein
MSSAFIDGVIRIESILLQASFGLSLRSAVRASRGKMLHPAYELNRDARERVGAIRELKQ